MTKKLSKIILLLFAVILINGCTLQKSLVNLNFASNNRLNIPSVLSDFTKDIILQDYVLQGYYFQEDNNQYLLHFTSEKNKKNLYPDVILSKNKKIDDYINSPDFITEFDIGNDHFIKTKKTVENQDGSLTECSKATTNGVLSISGFNYIWGEYSDCEQFLQKSLADNYKYTNSFEFNNAQNTLSNLNDNFQDCNRSSYTLVSSDPLKASNSNERVSADYVCNNQKIHIQEITYLSKEKSDCCLKMFDNQIPKIYKKVNGYDICTSISNSPAGWTAEIYKYTSSINTENYSIEIFSNNELTSDIINKVTRSFNSKNIGYNKVDKCEPGNI
jgi:hypothetical protein